MEVYRIRLIGIIKYLTMIVLATFFIGCEGPEEPSGESLMIRIKIPEDNMDAKSFRQLKKLTFKFLSDNRTMCVNASGSVLTVFTSDMYDKVPAVYFFNL